MAGELDRVEPLLREGAPLSRSEVLRLLKARYRQVGPDGLWDWLLERAQSRGVGPDKAENLAEEGVGAAEEAIAREEELHVRFTPFVSGRGQVALKAAPFATFVARRLPDGAREAATEYDPGKRQARTKYDVPDGWLHISQDKGDTITCVSLPFQYSLSGFGISACCRTKGLVGGGTKLDRGKRVRVEPSPHRVHEAHLFPQGTHVHLKSNACNVQTLLFVASSLVRVERSRRFGRER